MCILICCSSSDVDRDSDFRRAEVVNISHPVEEASAVSGYPFKIYVSTLFSSRCICFAHGNHCLNYPPLLLQPNKQANQSESNDSVRRVNTQSVGPLSASIINSLRASRAPDASLIAHKSSSGRTLPMIPEVEAEVNQISPFPSILLRRIFKAIFNSLPGSPQHSLCFGGRSILKTLSRTTWIKPPSWISLPFDSGKTLSRSADESH